MMPRSISAPRPRDTSVLRIEPAELLDALTGVDLGRVDVARAVDRDVVHDVELPGEATRAANPAEHGVRLAIDDAQLVSIMKWLQPGAVIAITK